MALQLHLAVRFFGDCYHGSDWPPSPARLFQALVAGAKTGAPLREWNGDHEKALEWLEELGAPEILARSARDGQRYTTFVPNNSLDRSAISTKTSKQVAPKILVNHSLGQPDVIYRWRVRDPDAARPHLPALDQLAARLRALGWGTDFAAARASLDDDLNAPGHLDLLTPDARGGTALRVPTKGLLAHLSECQQTFMRRISKKGVNPYTRPTRFGTARYRRADAWQSRRCIAFELQTLEGRPLAARWDRTAVIAAWMRHAAAEALQQEELSQSWIDSFVLGHVASGDPGHRLSFAPVPSIGHQYSDGGIRRVLIVEPPGASAEEAEALDLLRVKLAGWPMTDDRGAERAMLVPVSDERKVLPFYQDAARVWQTATPMILHGYNSSRGRISLAKTDRLLCQAFAAAGFPESIVADISFQAAPYWPGCEAANAVRVPDHLSQWPRVHVQVRFTEPVEGPVLAGIGRHYGIGLFAGMSGG